VLAPKTSRTPALAASFDVKLRDASPNTLLALQGRRPRILSASPTPIWPRSRTTASSGSVSEALRRSSRTGYRERGFELYVDPDARVFRDPRRSWPATSCPPASARATRCGSRRRWPSTGTTSTTPLPPSRRI
jgi:hypothetical protein